MLSRGARRARRGNLFLLDEMDGSEPEALVAFNAAMEDGKADFAGGTYKRHADFCIVAAADTYGTGPDAQYIRNQLDGATLDRFAIWELEYDETPEKAASGFSEHADKWHGHVTSFRMAADEAGIQYIISPRATINGYKLRDAGLSFSRVEAMVIRK